MVATSILDRVSEIGPSIGKGAAGHDADDTFVSEGYEALKAAGLFAAHVPEELGGGGASHADMCETVRELAHYCSSTALAFSMHQHLVAAATWRWNHGDKGGEGLLRRVAAEGLVLVSSGGSDWLNSSGTLVKVDGGYRMSGRKVFSSGSLAGDVMVTSAILPDSPEGPTVLHFPISLHAEGVTVLDNWRTLGMRGTASNDVLIEDLFVPEAAIGGRRGVGTWGPFHLVSMVAFPLIYSAYLGVAEAARNLAVAAARSRGNDPHTLLMIGEMENELTTARMAQQSMVAIAAVSNPNPETTNEIMMRRTILGQAAIRTVERAMEARGGTAFFREAGIERLFRDVQGARYHPLTEKRQQEFAGKIALGLPVE